MIHQNASIRLQPEPKDKVLISLVTMCAIGSIRQPAWLGRGKKYRTFLVVAILIISSNLLSGQSNTKSSSAGFLARWSKADRQAFAPLQAAARAYAQASGENEIDLSGSARTDFEIEQEKHLEDSFCALLEKLEAGNLPPSSRDAYKAADAHLNKVYQQIMAIQTTPDERLPSSPEDGLPSTTVTKRGIRTTQRIWLHYREAWVSFAARKYPRVSAESLRTFLTEQRINVLQDFVPKPRATSSGKTSEVTVMNTQHVHT